MKMCKRMCSAIFSLFLTVYILEELVPGVACGDNEKSGSKPMLPETIMTSTGRLRGKMFQSRNGRSYSGFLGIPYSNFSDTKRFQTAVPQRIPWDGIKEAMEFGPPCIQYDSIEMKVKGEENCLFLNVFTPVMVQNITETWKGFHPHPHLQQWIPGKNDTMKPEMSFIQMTPSGMPVIVFIHGGLGSEFQQGASSDFGTGKYFMDEDVILVTLNYRLGPFGFLSTGDGFAMGNMGLKDQVLALEWIRQNIIAFGGDPFRVTVFGEGSGSSSVHLLMMSPIAQGLFQRAMSLSGTSLDPGTFSTNPMEISKKFGEIFKCPIPAANSSSMELISCLRGKDPKELAEKSFKEFQRWGKDFRSPFTPCFENLASFNPKDLNGEPFPVIFLPSLSYADHLNTGSFNRVPWLIGVNKEEGLLQSLQLVKDEKLLKELNSEWNRIAPILFLYGDKISKDSLDAISGEIRKFYFRDAMIGPDVKENLTNLFSDYFYLRGMRVAVGSQAAKGQMIYPFLFDVMGMSSILSKFGINDMTKGPAHGDSLQYLFDMTNGMESKFEKGSEPEKMSKRLVRLWTTFAKFGVPMDETEAWEPVMSLMGGNPLFWHQMSSEIPMTHFSQSLFDRFNFWDYMSTKYRI